MTVKPSERGQVLILTLPAIFIFIFLVAALVDVYMIYEARNWGYQAAQQAALAGASIGRNWSGISQSGSCTGPGPLELDSSNAQNAARNMLNLEVAQRGLSGSSHDIRILPSYNGGTVSNYPPAAVRVGSGLGDWSADEPSVGVYFTFPVATFLMSLVGRPTVPVHVFASASVGQPEGVCPP